MKLESSLLLLCIGVAGLRKGKIVKSYSTGVAAQRRGGGVERPYIFEKRDNRGLHASLPSLSQSFSFRPKQSKSLFRILLSFFVLPFLLLPPPPDPFSGSLTLRSAAPSLSASTFQDSTVVELHKPSILLCSSPTISSHQIFFTWKLLYVMTQVTGHGEDSRIKSTSIITAHRDAS
ncbi:hypothetical protein SDJN03_10187, partial [Cucurbita argyrosperma subsp. sororia]